MGSRPTIPGLYIVQLEEAPVASYRGGVAGIAALPRLADRGDRADVRSPQARQYADHLAARQAAFVADVGRTFNTQIKQLGSFQYAYNGVALKLTAEQLAYVRRLPQVRLIEPFTVQSVNTDVGPGFIGAPAIWNGTATGGAPGSAGEGIVIGILDSGVNWQSPSFADIGGDGYDHVNPLGAGNYLGVCASEPADPDIGPACNDKVIGAWANSFDFVQQVNFECANPGDPGNELGLDPATCTAIGVPLLDYENALDQNGHGTHTASTAGGNEVAVTYQGNAITVQGVAKHANLIIYDVCHTNINGQGSCFNFASMNAMEQVVEDGIVDVVNFSIGGGGSPWTDGVSLGFAAAADAGVFVAASAGNSGPGPATLGHLEPWVSTTAATTHTRGPFEILFTANGTTVPSTPAVTNQPILLGSVGGPHDDPLVNVPVVISPDIDLYLTNPPAGVGDGCTDYAANLFAGAVAIIRRGGCAFSIKVVNAQEAGAISVIISNNAAGDIIPGLAPAVPFAVFGTTEARGSALRDYVNVSNGGVATITIPLNAIAGATQADVVADFSSRGPSAFDALKPDIAAPGVSVLAAYIGDSSTPSSASDPTTYEVLDGTSMASPHNAGSAALVRAIHPDWTVAEVKSALMMTSNRTGIVKEDGTTTADPFDRGAGRVNLNFAAESGLVMHESVAKMLLENPELDGGDPSSLNLPSLQNGNCLNECSWTRRVRSVASVPVTYTASFVGDSGLDVTITPSTFTINPGATQTLEIEADVSGATFGQFSHGDIVLQANIVASGPPYTEVFTAGAPIAIPDNGYAGGFNVPTQACLAVDTTGDVTGVVADVQMQITMAHTWIGDLTLKLGSPDGSVLGVMSIPGFNDSADDGTQESSGESSNLLASHPITFRDGAATSAEAMGAGIASAGVVCRDAPTPCEYSPAPGSVATPPSNFAGFRGENAAGVWRFCAGDSVGLDTGSLTALSITVQPGVAAAPTVHLPVSVFAVEPAPEITVAPASVVGNGVVSGPVVNGSITIGNEGVVDLNWNENNVPGAATVWQQIEESTGGIVSDFFVGDGTGAYTANDFVLNVETQLTEIFAPGFDNSATLGAQPSVTFAIFPDDGGVPSGDPEVDPSSAVWTYTANIGDPELDITADDLTLDLVAASENVTLPAGTYWLVAFATYSGALADGPRWNWSQGVAAGAEGVLISQSLFGGTGGEWLRLNTDLSVGWGDTAFRLDGIQSCGAPWLSIAPTSGTLAPDTSEVVTVAMDPTGLVAGTYGATLCIASNDPARPIVTVPITFNVAGLPTDPSIDGLATPAAAGATETTLLTVAVTPGANPTSSGVTVSADLSSIGGSATQALLDNGTQGDEMAGDGTYSYLATVAAGSTVGATTFAVSMSDAQMRTAADTIAFEVLATTLPSGVGLATPDTVPLGTATLLTVDTTGGANPPSTGLTVTVDLSSIGGSEAQAFVDNGTGGDAFAGDGIFSFTAIVPLATAIGEKTLDVTIGDAQARNGATTITLTIEGQLPDHIFGSGFEGSD